MKVAEIYQRRLTPFKEGNPRDFLLHWFKQKHLHLVMRVSQGLEFARAKAINTIMVQGFYSNSQQLYKDNAYILSNLWNVDESGCNASKFSCLGKALARKGIRTVYAQIPIEKKWLNVLTSITIIGWSIPHFFIFKEKEKLRYYVSLYSTKNTMVM